MHRTEETIIEAISEALFVEFSGRPVAIPIPNPPGQKKALANFLLETF